MTTNLRTRYAEHSKKLNVYIQLLTLSDSNSKRCFSINLDSSNKEKILQLLTTMTMTTKTVKTNNTKQLHAQSVTYETCQAARSSILDGVPRDNGR